MENSYDALTDSEWAKQHAPKGCYDPDRWNLGCNGCPEWFDAMDKQVPCKQPAIKV
jgi:hypothetical protein